MSRPPGALRRAAAALILECPDCPGIGTGLHWQDDRDAWTVRVYHLPTCPSWRSARRRRAVERWVLDQAAAVVPVSQYGSGDVAVGHRVRPAG
jgi:hypothetical protein